MQAYNQKIFRQIENKLVILSGYVKIKESLTIFYIKFTK